MKFRSVWRASAATPLLVAALSASSFFFVSSAHAAPKGQLEIWPGRRVLLVLPITPSATWDADPELGRAIVPLAQPQLQAALNKTGKFSITLPYRFDPMIRRGLAEKQLAEADITELLSSSTIVTAQPVVNKLRFDQPIMIAEVKLESLRVGGTTQVPTVQIQASGRLYEQGNPNAVKTITVTSDPARGKTPTDRIVTASRLAFNEIVSTFIAPPPAFELPLPKPVKKAPATGAVTPPRPTTPQLETPLPATGPPPLSGDPVAGPNSLSPLQGAPFVPQLPVAQPPLGIAAADSSSIGR